MTGANFYSGGQLFVFGLFKKVFLADRRALFSDTIFANAGVYDGPTTWLAALAYTLQIYFDFSGYSDMAIGTARIMGYELCENFNFPYLSRGPREFWRRWHISLSSWIRDYLYIPLGGSWRGPGRTYVNLLLSMTLCGLWHGVAWTFVVWGAVHGLALAQNRLWQHHGPELDSRLYSLVSWFFTMLLVVVGWVVFRSPDFHVSGLMLRGMFLPGPGIQWINPFVIAVLLGTAMVHVLALNKAWVHWVYTDTVTWYSPFMLCSLVWLVVLFYPSGFTPFIYFQF